MNKVLGVLAASWLCAATPHAARALDLETAMAEVAHANPTLAARRAMIEAARRRVGPAGAWESPMVALGVVNVPSGGAFDRDPMTMKMIEVTQRVPVFGSNRIARRAALAGVGAENANAEALHYELMGATWEAYSDAYFAAELVATAEGHRGWMDRLVQAARARYQATTGRLEDVLRAEAERAQIQVDIAGFQAEARAAQARLDAVRGRAPGAADSLAAPPMPESADPAAWQTTVTADHPRLRGFTAEASRARLSAAAARRATWPDLELRGSYGLREPIAGIAQDDMFSVMAGFTLPIFAATREGAEAAEREAMAQSADAERRGAELSLRAEAAGLVASLAAGVRTVRLLADTVVVAQERAVDASWSAYSAGTTDLWRVFESAHTLYGERIALLRARQDLSHVQARLLTTTTRGDRLGVRAPRYERATP